MIYHTLISALAVSGSILSVSGHKELPTASSLSLKEIYEAQTKKGTFKPVQFNTSPDAVKERAQTAKGSPNLRAEKSRALKGDKNNYIGYVGYGDDYMCMPENTIEIKGFLLNTCLRDNYGGSFVYKINKKQHSIAQLEYNNPDCMGVPDSLWDISSEMFPGFNDRSRGIDYGQCMMSPELGFVAIHYWTDVPMRPMDTMGGNVGVWIESQYAEDCTDKYRRPLSFSYWNDIRMVQHEFGMCLPDGKGGSYAFSDCMDGRVDMQFFTSTDCSMPFYQSQPALPHCSNMEDRGGDYMHEVMTATCVPRAVD